MDSGQDGNGFVGANGPNQFGGANFSATPNVSGNLNNSQVQTPQGGGGLTVILRVIHKVIHNVR